MMLKVRSALLLQINKLSFVNYSKNSIRFSSYEQKKQTSNEFKGLFLELKSSVDYLKLVFQFIFQSQKKGF
jgi:hypothetical protein